MNFCTRCASYYERPGTCNCFVPLSVTTQPIQPQDGATAPAVPPHTTIRPWIGDPYLPPNGTVTVRWSPIVTLFGNVT